MRDPIVSEIRAARDRYLRRFGYSLKKICKDLRRLEKTCSHPVVRLRSKRLRKVDRSHLKQV